MNKNYGIYFQNETGKPEYDVLIRTSNGKEITQDNFLQKDAYNCFEAIVSVVAGWAKSRDELVKSLESRIKELEKK